MPTLRLIGQVRHTTLAAVSLVRSVRSDTLHSLLYLWSDRSGQTHYTRCCISGQIGQVRHATLAAVSLVRSVRSHTLHSLQCLWSDRSDQTHYTRCSISDQIGQVRHTTLAAVSLVRFVPRFKPSLFTGTRFLTPCLVQEGRALSNGYKTLN